jgi:hypothetical protein
LFVVAIGLLLWKFCRLSNAARFQRFREVVYGTARVRPPGDRNP